MIVRKVGAETFIVRQPDHARQSGVVAAHLPNVYLGDVSRRHEFLLAVSRHDDGWIEWERDPAYEETGLPRNFQEINKQRHIDNWSRGIFRLLRDIGPFAASLLARHALPLVREKGEEVVAYFGELLASLEARAWPGLQGDVARFHTEQGAAALALADLASLIPLAGWTDVHRVVLLREDGSGYPVSLWAESDWVVRVDPWPFLVPALRRVPVDAIRIPAGTNPDIPALLAKPSDPADRIHLDILPVGPNASGEGDCNP